MRVRIGIIPSLIVVAVALVGGWARFHAAGINPLSGIGSSSPSITSPSGSLGSTSGASGICGDINGGKVLVQNLKNIGANPSLATLTGDLKKLQTKISAAQPSASATLKPAFGAVNTADNALQTSISQLKSSGLPASSYTQALKTGVGGIATAFDTLVSLSKCA